MDRRFLTFLLLATLLLVANMQIVRWLNPPPPPRNDKAAAEGTTDTAEATAKTAADKTAEKPIPEKPPASGSQKTTPKTVEEPAAKREWVVLGSADPASAYRMMVVLTTRGAAVEWAGLNSEQYLDLDALHQRRGYLGYLALTPAPLSGGAVVNVVGPGSPAAGHLQPGDIITSIEGQRDKEATPVSYPGDLEQYLQQRSRLGAAVKLQVLRPAAGQAAGQPQTVTVTLGKRPLEIIRPDGAFDPALSFMMTLAQLGDRKLEKETGITFEKGTGADDGAVIQSVDKDGTLPDSPAAKAGLLPGDKIVRLDELAIRKADDFKSALGRDTVPTGAYVDVTFKRGDAEGLSTRRLALAPELDDVRLQAADWQLAKHDESTVEFRRKLPAVDLEFVKRYTLATTGADTASGQAAGPAYHLTLDVEIINLAGNARKIAYQIDGPQGLPTEGWWYASKISRTSGTAGARDIVYDLAHAPRMYNAPDLGHGTKFDLSPIEDGKFLFSANDARYFAVAMKPLAAEGSSEPLLQSLQPLVVGHAPPRDRLPLTNTSFRLVSSIVDLGDQPLRHSYRVFIGPKERDILALPEYELSELIYYGWPIFAYVAQVMVWILAFFHSIVGNYGIAIILLTVTVRLCMFPISRKQALGAQKMQKLQPELKRLTEKYKNDMEGRAKAQRELFRKHNYNPAAGCLPVFLQLPIFIGLYKGLSLATELRQAPLIPGWFWCSDLSAPDRLFHWQNFLPDFLGSETGWLGPYFNLLPIITIVLFLVQQKMFMPPPTDEQQALQQKMMTYMMVFMGFMFFKVPSGLCIYFIASSLWGIAERKLLPKISHETDESPAPPVADARKPSPDKTKPRGGDPQGPVQRASNRLGDSALGRLFKSLSEAASAQPRSEAGKRRQKKRKGEK